MLLEGVRQSVVSHKAWVFNYSVLGCLNGTFLSDHMPVGSPQYEETKMPHAYFRLCTTKNECTVIK